MANRAEFNLGHLLAIVDEPLMKQICDRITCTAGNWRGRQHAKVSVIQGTGRRTPTEWPEGIVWQCVNVTRPVDLLQLLNHHGIGPKVAEVL
jgi:hypothetical protein